ncbi:DUF4397 domain-containing protein [uncultured Clostridium sp.]|uniref:DUF4397 domain-containing protein n=1 Tax=uncultured Clostridium sp. TaxID=59620 RepID=UPI0025E2C6B1|nr:DUF4397 domain-containing protein [uncultured Clostridium sp.]
MYLFRDSLPKIKGYLRFIHATPDAPNIDIYLNDKLIFSNLSFGNVTNYIAITPETYSIELYKTGTHEKTLISEPFQILPNNLSTINITFENNEIAFFSIDDTHDLHNNRLAYVRFINLAPTSPLISLSLPDERVLFNETSYLETNDYYPISAGIYNFIVSTSDGSLTKYISNIKLERDMFITIYIVGLYKKRPPLGYILVRDNLSINR